MTPGRALAGGLGLLLAAAAAGVGCRHARAGAPASHAVVVASATPSAAPAPPVVAAARAPSSSDCEALWSRYHAAAPEDPYVNRTTFVARCTRSTPAVLGCIERAHQEIKDMMHGATEGLDAGASGPSEPLMLEMMLRLALPSRMGICMTRERLRFALGSGELDALARDVVAGRLSPDKQGVAIASGPAATLSSRGFAEHASSVVLAPEGEVRVSRRPGGNVWLYFLGGLFGRHQNQAGFVYATTPFSARDFNPGEDGRDELCLARDEKG